MVMVKTIALGVREFALPVPRLGSIELHSGYGPLPISGQEIHEQFLQSRKKEIAGYQTELRLKRSFERQEYKIVVAGRVDGFYRDGSDSNALECLEEVKTDFNNQLLAKMLGANSQHPYCLQLKTYGYLYYLEYGTIPDLRMLAVSIRDKSFETIVLSLALQEYEEWLDKRIAEVIQDFEAEERIISRRMKNSSTLVFPFDEPRAGQNELISEVGNCVDQGNSMIVQAPTGLGKTLGVIYPALRSSLSRGSQLIYVTPKNSQHAVAREAIQRLQKLSGKIKAVIMTAKSKICMKEETYCNPEYCEFARDYYAKVADNDLLKKVAKVDVLDRHRFTKFARKYEVCPFELSLDSIKNADIVVGDYNYVFSPFNIMGRFSNALTNHRELPDLVIDEAHNLPARACGYYSAALSINQLEELEKKISHMPLHVAHRAKAVARDAVEAILQFRSESNKDYVITVEQEQFKSLLARAKEIAVQHLSSLAVPSGSDPILELQRLLETFVSALGYVDDEEFVVLYQRTAGGTIKLVCCDASMMLKDSYKKVRSVVGFSATLKPFNYYVDLMGLDADKTLTREFESPFPKDNRKMLVIPQISTKLRDRERNYGKIAEVIERLTQVKIGNYVVFFPSFDFLYQVKSRMPNLSGYETLVQHREMTQSLTEQFLNVMRVGQNPVILFAVQGGVFSEGVDYPGDMLIGSIIVGPALPTYDFERETLIRYFDNKYGDGNAYACIYPAMTKVVQSAGRVIRGQSERGVIVLLGRRFLQSEYVVAMPKDWYDHSVNELVSNKIISDLEDFWGSAEQPISKAN